MVRRNKQQKLLYYVRPKFYDKLLNELEEVEEKVCWLLAKYKHFRNCDTCLLFYYWREVENWNCLIVENIIHRLTAAETITRVRRYIQNDLHLWLPTDSEVILKRDIKKNVMCDWATNHKNINLSY